MKQLSKDILQKIALKKCVKFKGKCLSLNPFLIKLPASDSRTGVSL